MKNTTWRRAAASLAVVAATMPPMLLASTTVEATTLPRCPSYAAWPTKPVAPDVLAAIKKYYSVRHLTPVTVYQNRQSVLNVKTMSAGVHWCRNLDGGRSGYVGMVPKGALAAVLVHVKHKAYAVTQASSTFVTLAKMPKTGWKVVSDDTAP
jgi:hypothetical protein